jgi:hypothetical protein
MAQGVNLKVRLLPEYSTSTTAWEYGTFPAHPPCVIELPVTGFNVNIDQKKISSKALMGRRGVSIITNGDHAITGSFTFEVTPEVWGPIAFLIWGAENAPTTVESATVWAHLMYPINGAGTSLKSFTVQADYGVDAHPVTYKGCKVDSVSFAVDADNYLTCTINLKGQTYDVSTNLATATITPVLKPFVYKGAKVKFGTAGSTANTTIADAISFNPTWSNGLEDVRQRMDGNSYGQEPDYQLGEFTVDVECDYTTATSAYRNTNFLGGTMISAQLLYTHESFVGLSTAEYYTLQVDVPNAEVMNAPLNIGGPEREKITLSLRATDDGTNHLCKVTMHNGISTKLGILS